MEQGAPLGEKTEKFGHERPSNRNVIPLWTWYHLIQRMRKPGSGCSVPDDLVPKPVVGRRRARQNNDEATPRQQRARRGRRRQTNNAQRQQEENLVRQVMNFNLMNAIRQLNRNREQQSQPAQRRNQNNGQLNDPNERRRRRKELQKAFDNLSGTPPMNARPAASTRPRSPAPNNNFSQFLQEFGRPNNNGAPLMNARPAASTRPRSPAPNNNFWNFLKNLAPENNAALRPRRAAPRT